MARSALMHVMIEAVRKAARGLRRDFGEIEQLQVARKGPADFVSVADQKSEKTLYQELSKARPDYGFLMEEAGEIQGTDKDHRWIIDPLDGTTNFLHGVPQFAISVAAEHRGSIAAAVIYNPITDEMFTAEKGKGAFLNDRIRLRIAQRRELEEALICCGVPHRGRSDHPQFLRELTKVMGVVSGVRRFGAASLDLAYVAAGRFDGFWERDLGAWDMAAGLLLVREAGGFVSDADGGDDMLTKGHIVAGNGLIRQQLLALVKE